MSINGIQFSEEFYSKGKSYWEEIEPTIDGMLGGFTQITSVDIKASNRFLSNYFETIDKKNELLNKEKKINKSEESTRALDCGSGIGRVSKHLLLKYFDFVDLLEQNNNFLKETKNYFGEQNYKRIGNLINSGLQDFNPEPNIKYDCIWCQWVTGHLTDEDFKTFLMKCRTALKQPNGVIVVKDNTTSSDECDADTKDSSVTRPNWLFLEIFSKAGLTLLAERRQYKMPKGLYPVKMFALK